MNHPYRIPGKKKKKKRKPPRELVYAPGDQEKHVTPARSALQVFIAGSIVATLLLFAGWVIPGLVVMAITLFVAYRQGKRPPANTGAVLSVEKGWLKVFASHALEPRLSAALADVQEVTLDTRSIERGGADIGALSGLGGVGGSASVDLARICIVLDAAPLPERVQLTDAHFPRIESVEWLGKVRTFLRSHGWVPLDERVEAEEAEEPDDPEEPEAARAP